MKGVEIKWKAIKEIRKGKIAGLSDRWPEVVLARARIRKPRFQGVSHQTMSDHLRDDQLEEKYKFSKHELQYIAHPTGPTRLQLSHCDELQSTTNPKYSHSWLYIHHCVHRSHG